MQKSTKLVLAVVVVCFAIMAVNSDNAFAGPFENFVVLRLNQIGGALKYAVVPAVTEAEVPRTGQTTSYATGDDGDLEKGKPLPSPRFTDNGDGTVTDNMTGLIWLKNANCFGQETWADALTDCNDLASGTCGLTDGSVAGEWRLPNIRELHSLIHYGFHFPALCDAAGTGQWTDGDPFSGVHTGQYWTSTTMESLTYLAFSVNVYPGLVVDPDKTESHYVWPVRGPE